MYKFSWARHKTCPCQRFNWGIDNNRNRIELDNKLINWLFHVTFIPLLWNVYCNHFTEGGWISSGLVHRLFRVTYIPPLWNVYCNHFTEGGWISSGLVHRLFHVTYIPPLWNVYCNHFTEGGWISYGLVHRLFHVTSIPLLWNVYCKHSTEGGWISSGLVHRTFPCEISTPGLSNLWPARQFLCGLQCHILSLCVCWINEIMKP